MEKMHYHSLAHLATATNLTPDTFRKKVRVLLSNPEILQQMGYYPRHTLTFFQQLVLIKYLPDLFHLQLMYEDDLQVLEKKLNQRGL